jgi:hypothetical protein
MTVNVVDVTSNLQGAWLMEISQLMIELELYWPKPILLKKKELKGGEISLLSIDKSQNSLNGDAIDLKQINVILYTCNKENVESKTWWNDYPMSLRIAGLQRKNSTAGAADYDIEQKPAGGARFSEPAKTRFADNKERDPLENDPSESKENGLAKKFTEIRRRDTDKKSLLNLQKKKAVESTGSLSGDNDILAKFEQILHLELEKQNRILERLETLILASSANTNENDDKKPLTESPLLLASENSGPKDRMFSI